MGGSGAAHWISSPSSLKALPTSSINLVAPFFASSNAFSAFSFASIARSFAAFAAFTARSFAAFAAFTARSFALFAAFTARSFALFAASTATFDAASHVTLKPLSRSQTRRFLATSSAAFLAASAIGSMTTSTVSSTQSTMSSKKPSRRPGLSPQSKRRRPVMTFDVVSASSSTWERDILTLEFGASIAMRGQVSCVCVQRGRAAAHRVIG